MGQDLFSVPPAPQPRFEDYLASRPVLVNSKTGRPYFHLPVVGACTVCGLAGSVDLPADFRARDMDGLIEGRITKVACPRCRRETEFRPLTPKELGEEQFYIMRRYYDIYKRAKVDGQPLPRHVAEFVEEYEKRLRASGTVTPIGAPPPADAPPPGEPTRIVPA